MKGESNSTGTVGGRATARHGLPPFGATVQTPRVKTLVKLTVGGPQSGAPYPGTPSRRKQSGVWRQTADCLAWDSRIPTLRATAGNLKVKKRVQSGETSLTRTSAAFPPTNCGELGYGH